MAARFEDNLIVLDAESDIANIDHRMFPVIEDFEIQLEDTGMLGCHARMISAERGRIASFAWWDHADADLREMSIEEIPLGTEQRPFNDAEQGWEILIWEAAGYVFVLEGDAEEKFRFHSWFRVPLQLYRSSWATALEFARNKGSAFKSIAAALKSPLQVRTLLLGNQRLRRVPAEITTFLNLENLELHSNELNELPEEMSALVQLKRLDLHNNMIERLPETFSALRSLEMIDLHHNCLREIPLWFAKLPKLRDYDVSGNLITSEARARYFAQRWRSGSGISQ